MGPFQFQYWGDLLDGQMFAHEHGSQWCRVKDATDAGIRPSYHNDGAVTPPSPVMNIRTVTTRTTNSGTVRGADQKVSLDEALRAQTIDAAFILGRDEEIGSIKVGKFADFVELSADPYTLDLMKLETDLGIKGTWLNGSRIDLDAFLAGSGAEPAEAHKHLAAPHKKCC
jgi:predicted amidohydrolase YtcJ